MSSVVSLFLPRLPGDYLNWNLSHFMARHIVPRVWKQSVRRAATRCQIPSSISKHLHLSRFLARFFLNVFQVDRSIPSSRDIAISFACHLHEMKAAREEVPAISHSQVREFASCLRRSWLNGIYASFILRTLFKDSRDRSVSSVLQEEDPCLEDLDEVLASKERLFRAYFQTFTASDPTHHIHVWLSNEDEIVLYDEDRSVERVPVNLARGCEAGFFAPNCDFSLSEAPYAKRLMLCHADDTNGREYGAFQDELFFGIETGNIIWAR